MEILIVMVILVMIVGVVGFNLFELTRQERFRTGTGFLVDRLQLAQDIMIILEVDVAVVLEQKPGALSLRLQVDTSQLKNNTLLQKVVDPVNIPGIDNFSFTDARGVSQTDQVTLLFKSRGTNMSRGNLMLTAGTPDLTRYIFLAGYPQAITYS